MAKIVIIDDDMAMDALVDAFNFRGHEAYRVNSAEDALRDAENIVTADLVVLDIIMPWPNEQSEEIGAKDSTAGMYVLRGLRRIRDDLPVIAHSGTQDGNVIEALRDDVFAEFISKWDGLSVKGFISRVESKLGLTGDEDRSQIFIVHGRDNKTKLEVKNYLQNVLKFPEPTILHEQPNLGRTIIEKFEDYASMASVIVVVLTPDDLAAGPDDPNDQKRRARQNVVFEMGYFLGVLGRCSGRVLLLHSGPIELPSDISGVCYIDISNGIDGAGEQIRKELQHVFK